MSVIKEFIIRVLTDSKDAKKGLDSVEESSKKLTKTLKTNEEISNKLTGSFKGLAGILGSVAASYLSISGLFSGFKNAINSADQLGKLSDALGVNVGELDAWSAAVKRSGGSQEGFTQSVKILTASLAEFATKGRSRTEPFFKELGISMTDAQGKARGFSEVLPEIAEAFEKLGQGESFGIGRKMGLDEGTIMLLQKGRQSIVDLVTEQKELGYLTTEDAKASALFKDQLDNLSRGFRFLFTAASTSILPVLTKILQGFTKLTTWLKQNSGFVKAFIVGLASVLTAYLIPALIKTGIAGFAAMRPFLLLGAIIALFALLYDDIQNYLKGNKSLIGELIEKFPRLEGFVKGLIRTFQNLYDTVTFLWDVIKHLLGTLWEAIKIVSSGLADVSGKIYDGLIAGAELAKQVWNALGEIITSVFNKIMLAVDKVKSAYNLVKTSFTAKNPDALDLNVYKNITAIGQGSLAGKYSSSILNKTSSKTTNVEVKNINIETQATDTEDIASGISKALSAQLTQAINNFDDGVYA